MTTKELPKTYSPSDIEDKWYKTWDENKYFAPRKGKLNKPYSILMPPPNVTGKLHIGHALDVTTQDALIRYKRMKGYESIWIPGMDHAGIATQMVVEKLMWEEEKITKHDISREDFLQKIWKWKEQFGGIIAKQQRSLGASCDWDSFMFTMDKIPCMAVNKFFVDMYNQGLIYQSDYIVNWDTVLGSAISDAEVEHKEVNGAFYHLNYQVKDSDVLLEVATTRPETLLGDTAVAVNPNDERFNKYIGKTAIVPLCNREVPIIGDEYVDIEKGTGCLKVTPGHDFNDFEIGKRNNLEIINLLNKDGTLNEYGLEWKGKTSSEARKPLVEKLKAANILVEVKPHVHQVGHGDRSKSMIEPMVSKQWFMKMTDMSAEAVKMVENDTTKFYAKSWENTYFSWLREPKDWCISRQLVWGHRIPIFYCKDCNHQWADTEKPNSCPKCNSKAIFQDPDVLDTWFSSGLWPMTTLGWPDPEEMKKRQFEKFLPSSTLVTGFDIIFFWVARMMMMVLKVEQKVPFDKVYIHAIVRDKLGRKMSKTLGNGIDPLDMVEKYGADALRFCLAAGSGYNRNIDLDPDQIAGYRNFINKIWNAFRFIVPSLDLAKDELPSLDKLSHHERWILSELNTVTDKMNKSMDEFRFDDSCSTLYAFIYDKFCSWFIELSKNILYGEDESLKIQRMTVLKYSFKKIVALLHPFSPFITEEIWQVIASENSDLLIIDEYPEHNKDLDFKLDQEQMNQFIEIVTHIRNLRSNSNIKPKEEISVEIFSDSVDLNKYLNNHQSDMFELCRTKELKTAPKSTNRPTQAAMSATTFAEIFVKLDGVIDLDEQIQRLTKEKKKILKDYNIYEKKLSNPKFLENARPEVIEDTKSKFQGLKEKIASIDENLAKFQS